MSESPSSPNSSLPSSDYTREYYESCCQGHQEFHSSLGQKLPLRLEIPLRIANVRPGKKVIDIGCGRGETVLHCAQKEAFVWGIDYARDAVKIAADNLNIIASPKIQNRFAIQQANACQLPFMKNSADIIFMLDIVEHLYPPELNEALDEAWRILKPGGLLIVHTMPNLWYYRLGYPIYRWLQHVRGQDLPTNPRERWRFSHVHVNEQTPLKIKKVLQNRRFKTRVWLESTQIYDYERNPLVRWGMIILTSIFPFKLIFCNDIFAIGTKSLPHG
jgi:ubiquinone/menaquinone biosynthesis C-methylase UbiE